MSKYIITGGAGFIGSNIARALVAKGDQVKIIDNLSSGNIDNIKDIKNRVEFIEGDIRDLELLQKEFSGSDYILHHAAFVSVPASVEDPILANASNIDGTLNVLIAARDCGVKRVVFATSSAHYGDIGKNKADEEMPSNPVSPYALQKSAGEAYCKMFYDLYGLETVCLRYFNVFGPGQNPKSEYAAVIPKFITIMSKGERPTIFGDGEQSRDFTYIDNNIAANILAATAEGVAGQVLNIASGETITLNELVAAINAELGTHIAPDYQDARKGDIRFSSANIEKARKVLKYEPAVGFTEGLRKTIEWYKSRI